MTDFIKTIQEAQQQAQEDMAIPKGYRLARESKSERLQMLVRPELKEAIKAEAEAQGLSMNELVNNILEEYLAESRSTDVIKVIVVAPNEEPYYLLMENTLERFQKEVDGYIETVTFAEDCCIICDEEGYMNGKPDNFGFLGQKFVGTCLFVGVKGDEFADVPLRVKQVEGLIRR
jgi:predicted DNA binding CopG/RHH family protein